MEVGPARRPANPWRAAHARVAEVSSPPPIFNFDAVPTVVGGSVRVRRARGAVHGIFKPCRPRHCPVTAGAGAGATAGSGSSGAHH